MLEGIIFMLIISGILTCVKVRFPNNKIANNMAKAFTILSGLIASIIIQR